VSAASEAADQLVALCGVGFHPDTPAEDVCLTDAEAEAYERDRAVLITAEDPYMETVEACRRAGIL
jgi:hypothetical protein